MRIYLTLAVLSLLYHNLGCAQGPSPCGTPALMTPTCQEACVICDINGFKGRNTSPFQGTVPPGFCTMNVQNAQWIAFVAGSTSLQLKIAVSNCVQGQGLQIGLYRGDDCTNFARISNCINGLDQGSVGTFITNQPLTIGQYYWLVIDGQDGDVCDYAVQVTQGTTAVMPLTVAPSILGSSILCSNEVSTYRMSPLTGATDYQWTIDGAVVGGNADSVQVSLPTPGQYQLCVRATNACDEAPLSCKPITVMPTFATGVDTFFCESRCISLEDSSICNAGVYSFTRQSVFGCDSIVTYTLSEIDAVIAPISVTICEGDTLFVGPYPYTTTGHYVRTLPTIIDCDSTIQLSLTAVVCQIQTTSGEVPVRCNGANDGSIRFRITHGTAPFSYQWQRLASNPPLTGSGTLAAVAQDITLSNLQPGLYSVTINDGFGNQAYLLQDVTEPAALSVTASYSDYAGYEVSCPTATDGSIGVTAQGGVGGYAALWSTGSTSLSGIQNLAPGTYTLTLTDANQCTLVTNFTLTAPDPLQLDAQITQPDCSDFASGSIQVTAVTGGVAPYQVSLNGRTDSVNRFSQLGAGTYPLLLTDANNCTLHWSGTLTEPAIPIVDLPETATILLGDSLQLSAALNQYAHQLNWLPLQGLSCRDCPTLFAKPAVTTTYTLSAISDSGCVRKDSIRITVIPQYDIYVPNVFTPDKSSNSIFTVYGGPEVATIKRFEVYSRWGDLVYRQTNLAANDESRGWNGTFRDRRLPPALFSWLAEIEFIDGVTKVYSGDVSLVR